MQSGFFLLERPGKRGDSDADVVHLKTVTLLMFVSFAAWHREGKRCRVINKKMIALCATGHVLKSDSAVFKKHIIVDSVVYFYT